VLFEAVGVEKRARAQLCNGSVKALIRIAARRSREREETKEMSHERYVSKNARLEGERRGLNGARRGTKDERKARDGEGAVGLSVVVVVGVVVINGQHERL